jgi:DNA modification methylase
MQETIVPTNKNDIIKKVDDEEGMVVKRLGFLPTSVWEVVKSKRLTRYVDDELGEGSYGDKAKGNLSQFNPDVAERILKIWSKEGGKVLDPFSGRCRALIAQAMNRRYIGYEISPTAHEKIIERLERKTLVPFKHKAKVICADSKTINKIDEFDLVFSCPPYWDVEDYDKEYGEKVEGQLSSLHNYKHFLEEYYVIICNCFKALKPGKYCVWVVNDIRRNKRLVPFASDTINCFERAGFKLHDVVINKLFGLAVMGVGQAVANGYTPKMHEYILVFKKPGGE